MNHRKLTKNERQNFESRMHQFILSRLRQLMRAKGIPAKEIANQINVSEVHLSRLGKKRTPPPTLIKAWMEAIDYKPSQTKQVVHLLAGLKADRERTAVEEKKMGIERLIRSCDFFKGKSFDGVNVFLSLKTADKLQEIIVGIDCSQKFVFFFDKQLAQETTIRSAAKTLNLTGQKATVHFIIAVLFSLIEELAIVQLEHLRDYSGLKQGDIIKQSEIDEKTEKLYIAIQIFHKHIFPSSTGDWLAI